MSCVNLGKGVKKIKARECLERFVDSREIPPEHLTQLGLSFPLLDMLKPDRPLYIRNYAAVMLHKSLLPLLTEELRLLNKVSKSNGLKVVHMKGFYLAKELYDEPSMRPFGDIDILVEKANAECACYGMGWCKRCNEAK